VFLHGPTIAHAGAFVKAQAVAVAQCRAIRHAGVELDACRRFAMEPRAHRETHCRVKSGKWRAGEDETGNCCVVVIALN
jgi:hypothetical protein